MRGDDHCVPSPSSLQSGPSGGARAGHFRRPSAPCRFAPGAGRRWPPRDRRTRRKPQRPHHRGAGASAGPNTDVYRSSSSWSFGMAGAMPHEDASGGRGSVPGPGRLRDAPRRLGVPSRTGGNQTAPASLAAPTGGLLGPWKGRRRPDHVSHPPMPNPLRHPTGVKGASRRSRDGLRPPLTPVGRRSLGTGREMAAERTFGGLCGCACPVPA